VIIIVSRLNSRQREVGSRGESCRGRENTLLMLHKGMKGRKIWGQMMPSGDAYKNHQGGVSFSCKGNESFLYEDELGKIRWGLEGERGKFTRVL